VIIVEGIYALNDKLLSELNNKNYIKNFVQGNEKTLFLRRLIRDAKITGAGSAFTVKNYFDYVYPNYKNSILPTKKIADIFCDNNMTFEELRTGNKVSKQQKAKVQNYNILTYLINNATNINTVYERDLYIENNNKTKNEFDNILRLRTISNNGGKNYHLSSLVHKGAKKLRKDNLVLRPVNILIKEGEFENIYDNENQFLDKLKENGFRVSKTIVKKRTRLTVNNNNYKIDEINNQGVFLEYKPDNNSTEVEYIKKCTTKCSPFYNEIKDENYKNEFSKEK